ncbi:DUF58 domain-containing protein [Candidatus Pacearchaeota archaeon]|nr:DUF58 domain-containing protein [Candidatus Pacearchaeota archaeon]
MEERKLNINIPEASFRFEALLERLLPKRVFYKLLLRGKGLEFDGYRDFIDGDDDSSLIDWKATARAGKTLTKQYVEERDIKILFVVDVSESMIFGSTEKIKCEYTAELAGALGRVLLNDPRDRLGYVLYNGDIVKMRMPEPGMKQYESFVHELSDPANYGGRSDLKNILNSLMDRLDPTISLIVIISDFNKFDYSTKQQLEDLGAFLETVAILVKDPLDMTFPDVDREVIFEDPNSKERILVNPKVAKKLYEENAKILEKKTRKMLSDSNIENVRVMTDKDFCPDVAMFLKERTERRG